jgi:hypothetical protein
MERMKDKSKVGSVKSLQECKDEVARKNGLSSYFDANVYNRANELADQVANEYGILKYQTGYKNGWDDALAYWGKDVRAQESSSLKEQLSSLTKERDEYRERYICNQHTVTNLRSELQSVKEDNQRLRGALDEMIKQFWGEYIQDTAYATGFRRDFPNHPIIKAEQALKPI